jgi:hypothetical protein
VPEALRAAGLDLRVHDELFPQATQDVVWLREAGAQRWVVITRDDRIRYNQLEKQAVLAAKLRFFSITSSSLTGDEAASLILSAVRTMMRLCRQYSTTGFIAKISRGPEVRIIEKGRR